MMDNVSQKFSQGSIVDSCCVVAINDDIDDDQFKKLCNDTVEYACNNKLKGVVINFSNMRVVDTYIMKLLLNVTKVIACLGLKAMWTGLRPGVISSILDLNLDIDGIVAGENVERCILKINEANEVKSI